MPGMPGLLRSNLSTYRLLLSADYHSCTFFLRQPDGCRFLVLLH
jgi:hypothetical protein